MIFHRTTTFSIRLTGFSVIAAIILFHSISVNGVHASQQASVLLLNAYHQGLEWTDNVTGGVTKVLGDCDLHVEYMDAKRHADERYQELLRGLLFKKYQGVVLDVVIGSDDHALAFLLKHRDHLFPGVPIVFCGINDYSEGSLAGHDRITGVVESFDIKSTIQMALRLHPGVRRVVVVNDTTKTGRANRAVIEKVLPAFPRRIHFDFLENLTMPDLLTSIERLPAEALVLMMSYNRDAAGQVFDYETSIRMIAPKCPVPIYGVWDFYLGLGIVGGKLTSGWEQGKAAAAIARRIIDGADADTIPVITRSPNRWMFDHRQLARFAIADAGLPDDSVIINQPQTVYRQYKVLVWSATLLITILTILSIALLANIKRRQRIEGELRDSRQFLEGITANVPGVIYQFYATADGSYGLRFASYKAKQIFGLDVGLDTFFDAFCQCLPEAERSSFLGSIADAVDRFVDWHYEGRFIRPDNGNTIWFSGNSVPHHEGETVVFDGMLLDISDIKAAEEKLRRSEQQMSQIIDFLPDPTFVIDLEGRVIAWNRSMEEITGVDAGAMLGKGDYAYAEVFYGERRPIMIDMVAQWDAETAVKYRGVRKKGEILISESSESHRPFKDQHFKNTAGPLYDENGRMIGAIETIHDITERRKTEKALAESEALMRLFVENTPAAVAMCDTDMNYLAYSRRWITDYRLPDEDLRGRCHYDVFGVVPDPWKEQHRRCFAGETIENAEEPFKRADGTTDWVRRTLHPWRSSNGDIGGLFLFTEVTTSKKQAEENLGLMERVLENSPAVLFRWKAADDGWPVAYVSENISQFGYTADEFLSTGKPYASIIHPDDLDTVKQLAASPLRRDEEPFQQEYRILTKTGEYRWVDDRAIIHRDENGNIIHTQGVVLDITDRKNAQEEVHKRQMFLESVLYHAPDAVIILDADQRVTDWNPGAEKIFGYRREEAIGLELDAMVTRDRARLAGGQKTHDFLAGRRVEAFETVRHRKDGTPVNVIAAGSPIMVDGDLQAVVAMYTDISALKRAEDEVKRRERMLRRIMDIVPSMIFVRNAKGRFLMANKAVADSYGTTVEALVGRHHQEVHPDPLQVGRFLADDQKALASGRPLIIAEEPYRDSSGATRWLEVVKMPCDEADFGEPAIVGLATDITERREAEARLHENEKRYRNVFENTGTGTVLSEADTTLSMVNKEFATMVGYAREEIEGKMSWTRFIVPEDVERMMRYHNARRVDPSGVPTQWECRLVDRAGNVKRMLLKVRLIPGTQTSIGAFLDITELKRVEKERLDTNRMLRLVLDTIPVRVFWKDRECRYLGSNQVFAEDAGLGSPDRLVGKTDYDLAFANQAERFRRDDRLVMDSGESRLFYEERQDRPDGQTNWVLTSKVPMRDDKNQIFGVLGTYQDITDRKQAEGEVVKLRNYLSNIIDSMPSVLVGVDAEGRVTQWNRQAERITGVSSKEALSQPLQAVFPRFADEMERIDKAIRNREVIREPKMARHQGGETRFEEVTVFPLVANGVDGAVIRLDDVTERVRLEEMMIQSEKMLSVGGLAAGMAHEINNPLAGILQNASVLENRLMGDLPSNHAAAEAAGTSMAVMQRYIELRRLPDLLENIRISGKRAATIVKNMLSFARKSERMVSSHDLVELLDQTIELVQTDYDMKKQYDFKKIKIIREYDASVGPVPCEGSKLQQVFLNILKNGAEAMAGRADESIPPTFTLRVQADGSWVRTEIEDNGPGIPEATRRRIFEPFFTTKPVGKGTGLGLSVSYFIITENHGGKMDVVSAPGMGTRFIIRLPREGKA